MQFSEWIEAFENETAIVAKEFVKTDHTKQYDSIVVIALNPLTFTSRASHAGFQPRVIPFYQNCEQAANVGNQKPARA